MDAAFVVLQSLISRMKEMVAGPYCVEHDQSKNLLAYNDFCSAISTTNKASSSDRPKLRALDFRSN